MSNSQTDDGKNNGKERTQEALRIALGLTQLKREGKGRLKTENVLKSLFPKPNNNETNDDTNTGKNTAETLSA